MTNTPTCLLTVRFYTSIPSDFRTPLLSPRADILWAALFQFQVGLNTFNIWGRLCRYFHISTVFRKISDPCSSWSFVPTEDKSVIFSWNPNQFASRAVPNSEKKQFKSRLQGYVGNRTLSYCQVSKMWQLNLDLANLLSIDSGSLSLLLNLHPHVMNVALGTAWPQIKKQPLWGLGHLSQALSSVQGQIWKDPSWKPALSL